MRTRRIRMGGDYKLSVLFCAVDESESLKKCFLQFLSVGLAYEYLFVLAKDHAPQTLETVKTICAEHDGCRYMIQSGYGYGNAIRDAFFEVSGTHMLLWTADGGLGFEAAAEMMRVSAEHPDKIVKISRWIGNGGFVSYGFVRRIINGVSQKAFAKLYRSELTDFTSPAQIASIEMYRKIKWERNGFDFLPEMIFKPLKLGYDFIEVPCKNLKRTEGKSHSSFFELAKYYFVILDIYRMSKNEILAEDDR